MTLKLKEALLIGVLAIAVSCGQEGTGTTGGGGNKNTGNTTTSTTLSALRDKATDTSTEYDITVKDLVVTAVYENYAQIEDATAGAQVNASGHGLKVGQKFNGKVKLKARVVSGALLVSSIDVSSATASTTSSIPSTTITLPEILSDNTKYMNMRMKLENITFVNGFSGTANGSGSFSQKGKQVSAICRPSGVNIEDGSQGDLYCYPTSTGCVVYDAADFYEHEYTSAFTKVSDFGVYNVTNDKPSSFFTYTSGTDEYAYFTTSSEREFRIQNYSSEWVLRFTFPVKLKNGQEITLTTSPVGLSQFTEGTSQVTVEKISGDMLWLMDYSANKGYVFKITEE